MTAAEARYLRARRMAHRAWALSQPQFVLPGVLDEPEPTVCRSGSSSAPRPASPSPEARGGRARTRNTTGPARRSPTDTRGRGQKERF